MQYCQCVKFSYTVLDAVSDELPKIGEVENLSDGATWEIPVQIIPHGSVKCVKLEVGQRALMASCY